MPPFNLNTYLDSIYSKTKISNKDNVAQITLCILFVLFLAFGNRIPEVVATKVDTTFGKIIVVLLSLVLFAKTNPLLGAIGFFVAYELIRRSKMATGTYALEHYLPTEKKKASVLTSYNQFPYTLEQEVVKKMAPLCAANPLQPTSTFTSDVDDLHDAAPIDYTGVI